MSKDLLKNAQFKILKYAEVRAVFEWQSFYLLRGLMRRLPKGDGHPVIVFPGFVSSDLATRPMRSLFDDLGYSTYGWGLGRNLIFDQKREKQMRNLLKNVYQKEGRQVSLIGWSLGGLFAREVAKANPEYVRCVISMGSPISGAATRSNAKDLFQAINGNPGEYRGGRFQDTNQPPPVPTTSIYTKTDGIVHWESSVQRGSYPQTENIEVLASHLGLGVNALVMMAVADRLAQPEGDWVPFDRSGFKRLVFTDSKQTWGDTFAGIFRNNQSMGA
ncbi:MAG: pimeloyl-ACP methyl ester carboxylesterase [Arenicella sp.]|jgi:pimeloyl-ACP methyl ester carboxylesterase